MSTQNQPRPRANYSQELRDKIDQLLVQVASLPSRAEIVAEFDKRVSTVAYQSDRKALEDRIAKLEQASQNWWGKAAVVVSAISVVVSILVATHAI